MSEVLDTHQMGWRGPEEHWSPDNDSIQLNPEQLKTWHWFLMYVHENLAPDLDDDLGEMLTKRLGIGQTVGMTVREVAHSNGFSHQEVLDGLTRTSRLFKTKIRTVGDTNPKLEPLIDFIGDPSAPAFPGLPLSMLIENMPLKKHVRQNLKKIGGGVLKDKPVSASPTYQYQEAKARHESGETVMLDEVGADYWWERNGTVEWTSGESWIIPGSEEVLGDDF